MEKRLAVINVVGLSKSLLGPEMPRITKMAEAGVTSFPPAFPAVTCTAQSSYLTGKTVGQHGVVGNGWYDRDDAEVKFWKQSNHLVKGEKLWDAMKRRHPGATCAKLFWWYNMYSTADYTITPRPMYPADGRKFFDVYTQPMEMREEVKADLGAFPFPAFWGPRAGIASSQWIADSARWVEKKHQPTLSLIYLPHLDYCLQKEGPDHSSIPQEKAAIDQVVGTLVDDLAKAGVESVLLSEYGISKVDQPVHLNRVFREQGWLAIKKELGRELLDCGASQVFAVADHQVAHVYLNDDTLKEEVRSLLEQQGGVEEVLNGVDLWPEGTSGGERGGDLVVVAKENTWFTYYYWEEDTKAPDFARTIDIHRKPGYDPVELFIDPELSFPMLKVASFLMKKKLGIRGLMEVIPLDAKLVKGSHGRSAVSEQEQPVLIGPGAAQVDSAEGVFYYLLDQLI